MKLEIKLLCTDFHGTLHTDLFRPPVPARLQHQVARLQHCGAKWILTSGQDAQALQAELEQGDLGIWPDFIVTREREIHERVGDSYVPLKSWNKRSGEAHEAWSTRVAKVLGKLDERLETEFQVRAQSDDSSLFQLMVPEGRRADLIAELIRTHCAAISGGAIVRSRGHFRLLNARLNNGTALAAIAHQLRLGPGQVMAAGGII